MTDTPKGFDTTDIAQKWFDKWCTNNMTIKEAIAAGIQEGTDTAIAEYRAASEPLLPSGTDASVARDESQKQA